MSVSLLFSMPGYRTLPVLSPYARKPEPWRAHQRQPRVSAVSVPRNGSDLPHDIYSPAPVQPCHRKRWEARMLTFRYHGTYKTSVACLVCTYLMNARYTKRRDTCIMVRIMTLRIRRSQYGVPTPRHITVRPQPGCEIIRCTALGRNRLRSRRRGRERDRERG